MQRKDIFANVHKAIRAQLFATATAAARTAFERADEAADLDRRARVLFSYLGEHHDHEEAVVMPELQRLAPGLFAELQHEHARIGGLQGEIAGLLDRLVSAGAGERPALGRRLQHRLHLLVAAHLSHLEHEEEEANRVLWAHLSDAELRALHARILARIPPPRLAEWLAVILPALAQPDQAQMLDEMRRQMPASAFTVLTARARAALGEAAWQAASAAEVA